MKNHLQKKKLTPRKLADLIKKGVGFSMDDSDYMWGSCSAVRPKKSEFSCYSQLADLLSALLRNKLFASVADKGMIAQLAKIRDRMEAIARGEEDHN